MLDFLKELLGQLRDLWGRLGWVQRGVLVGLPLLVLLLFVGMLARSWKTEYAVLYSELEPQEAAAIVALGTYGLVLFLPILQYVRIGKTLENSSDYSINKTTVQMLFLPTSREVKYKAKQATDSFFHRVGDVGSAVVVFVGTALMHLDARGFALINVLFIVGWFFLVRGIAREHREMEAGRRPGLTEPEEPLAA